MSLKERFNLQNQSEGQECSYKLTDLAREMINSLPANPKTVTGEIASTLSTLRRCETVAELEKTSLDHVAGYIHRFKTIAKYDLNLQLDPASRGSWGQLYYYYDPELDGHRQWIIIDTPYVKKI